MNFKPMLSASLDGVQLDTLRYPLVASPKLDGIRCVVWEGVAYSRNAKPLRNAHVQRWANDKHNLDGELIVGSATDPLCLNNTQSGVMSAAGEPDFTYHLFDSPERAYPGFLANWDWLRVEAPADRLVPVPHTIIRNASELEAYERGVLAAGYEGVMVRDPDGPYKHGRSTVREGYLMKLKQFQDGEAVVTGVEEGHTNINVQQRDELGRAKRATHADGMLPSGMVGTILADDPVWGPLRVSPGIMTHAERAALLANPARIVGKTIHWRSFGYGAKDKPRFARYYGVREDL